MAPGSRVRHRGMLAIQAAAGDRGRAAGAGAHRSSQGRIASGRRRRRSAACHVHCGRHPWRARGSCCCCCCCWRLPDPRSPLSLPLPVGPLELGGHCGAAACRRDGGLRLNASGCRCCLPCRGGRVVALLLARPGRRVARGAAGSRSPSLAPALPAARSDGGRPALMAVPVVPARSRADCRRPEDARDETARPREKRPPLPSPGRLRSVHASAAPVAVWMSCKNGRQLEAYARSQRGLVVCAHGAPTWLGFSDTRRRRPTPNTGSLHLMHAQGEGSKADRATASNRLRGWSTAEARVGRSACAPRGHARAAAAAEGAAEAAVRQGRGGLVFSEMCWECWGVLSVPGAGWSKMRAGALASSAAAAVAARMAGQGPRARKWAAFWRRPGQVGGAVNIGLAGQ